LPVPARSRSELECFVLGLVWQLGPCSPYDLRRHTRSSPSSQWSASAGAIYPLIGRLHRAGLLNAKDRTTGKRRRREYTITPAGLKALRAWIGPPLAPEAITVAYDPLRSRARFLGALPTAARQKWCDAALQGLAEVEARVRDWQKEYGGSDPLAPLITRSGELDVQGRTRWVRELREFLG
jgi:DNA-binding PadR family transcriptional regulator